MGRRTPRRYAPPPVYGVFEGWEVVKTVGSVYTLHSGLRHRQRPTPVVSPPRDFTLPEAPGALTVTPEGPARGRVRQFTPRVAYPFEQLHEASSWNSKCTGAA